jgi:hypothetical protein
VKGFIICVIPCNALLASLSEGGCCGRALPGLIRVECKTFVGKVDGKRPLGDLTINGKKILKQIINK